MKKINIKNKKLLFITLLIIILVILSIICFININISIKTFNNNNFKFNYDNSWKIKTSSDNKVTLNHNDNGFINIEVINLDAENKYKSIDDLLDSFKYKIEQQNSNYKLIGTKKENITKKNYDGYKLLYETETNQVMVIICKKGDTLVLFTYESLNEYFDILLDSVQNIIYDFDTVNKSYDLSYKINISSVSNKWSDNDEITSNIKDSVEYENADNNYLVKYSIPSNFVSKSFDSKTSFYTYDSLKQGSINLSTNIRNINIYEFLNSEGNSKSLYYSYNKIKTSDSYLNYEESIEKIDTHYIYINSYNDKSNSNKYTNVYVVYELDKSHIFIIKIESNQNDIPASLINKINMNSFENYSSYVKRNVIDNTLIGELKYYNNEKKENNITLKLPIELKEIDKNSNIYSTRHYVMNYDSDKSLYQYEIKYNIVSNYVSENGDLIDDNSLYKNNDNYKKMTFINEIDINNKKFKVYEGGYTTTSYSLKNNFKYSVNVKYLVYQLDNKYLTIEVKGNESLISNELLNSITNFDIELR